MIKSKKSKNKISPRYNIACHPVEKIIGFYTGKEKRRYYRVQWAPSWVPEENLLGCDKLIEQFFVEENIINKDTSDVNESKITKIKLKLEEEDYACWGCEQKPTIAGEINDDIPDNDTTQTKEELKIKCEEKDKKGNDADIADNVDDGDNKSKSVSSTPSRTPSKPASRAMMATNSPSFMKSPLRSPGREEKPIKVENDISNNTVKHIKKEDDESPRKYHTRLYYKELRANLRKARNNKKIHAPRKDENQCKVYNTRLRARQHTRNQRHSGFGVKYVKECVQKLPYGVNSSTSSIRKSSSPRRKLIKQEKPDSVGNVVGRIISENIDGRNDDNQLTPRIPNQSHFRKNINVKKEFRFNEHTVIKQEPMSPKHVCVLPAASSQSRDQNTKNMNNVNEKIRYECYDSFFQRTTTTTTTTHCIKNEPVFYTGSMLLKECSLPREAANACHSSSEDSEEGSNETPFECDVCEKMFQTSVLLHRHRFVHCENRPFSFNKRRPITRLRRENKENYDGRKFKPEIDDSAKAYSHHLRRPRRDVKDVR